MWDRSTEKDCRASADHCGTDDSQDPCNRSLASQAMGAENVRIEGLASFLFCRDVETFRNSEYDHSVCAGSDLQVDMADECLLHIYEEMLCL